MRSRKQFCILWVLIVFTVFSMIPGSELKGAKAGNIRLNVTKKTLYAGDVLTLKLTGTKAKVTWSSSDKSVATVTSKGKVTAKGKGTVQITARVSGVKKTCKITVKLRDAYAAYHVQQTKAADALVGRLLEEKDRVYVYKDFSDQTNHFTQRSKMSGGSRIFDMDENCTKNPYSGNSCIRCEIKTGTTDWGGWQFLTGTLKKGDTVPKLNTGKEPGQGLDLTGAQSLKFYAKGEKGGETVEFFTCGFGYDGESGVKMAAYPDSAKKQTLGFVTLTNKWKLYEIPLLGNDLSYIVCGFGFVCSGMQGSIKDHVFYLDEIQFTGNQIACVTKAPTLLRSYDTDNIYTQNAAFSYDNALTAMAFLSDGKKAEAKEILDAFVYAIEHDLYLKGRVRNAYAAGSISPAPGWDTGALLPGWYDKKAGKWQEDQYQVGCNTGVTSYVALALLQYDAVCGGKKYQKMAQTLMDWVLENCQDANPGFTAGYDGWPEGDNPVVYHYTYKSTEHNIDAYAVFDRLYQLTGEEKYKKAKDSALDFLKTMYQSDKKVFCTGTKNDGVTPEDSDTVLDTRVWTAMALGGEFEPFSDCLSKVKDMSVKGAYPFCESNKNGGWWSEGTAFTSLMFRQRGDDKTAMAALDALCGIQLKNGLFPAATVDNLSTGIYLFTGEAWLYNKDAAVAPTAWFVMAVNGFNPYRFPGF